MPAPSYIATFIDADGDEFPVRVCAPMPEDRETAIEAGAIELANLIRAGSLSPTDPMKWDETRLEALN